MPFGSAGIRVLKGQANDAHYGWGGVFEAPSGKLIHIYRKGAGHAITDGAEVRICFSDDGGKRWYGDRQLYQSATHDARPDAPRLFANGRCGVLINRQDEGTTHFSPIVIYSDDEFVAHEVTKTITTPSGYTFSSSGGWMEFPAYVGGHDTLGFMAFGFAGPGGYDAITTVDNLETFQIVNEVAQASGASTGLSEWAGFKLPSEDKWFFYLRNKNAAGWRDEAACFVTTDPLNWGTMLPSGKNLGGNPPFAFVHPTNGRVYFGAFARAGRGIDGLDHHMLIVSATPTEISAANGDWSTISPQWEIVTPIPNWATGYLAPFSFNGEIAGAFTCAEPGSAGGDKAAIAMIGDFVTTDAERTIWADLFTRNAIFDYIRLGFGANYKPSANARISIGVDSGTLGIMTEVFGNAYRDHIAFFTLSGKAGAISAASTTVTYGT